MEKEQKDYLKEILKNLGSNIDDKESILNSISRMVNSKDINKAIKLNPVSAPKKVNSKKQSVRTIEQMSEEWLKNIIKDLPLKPEPF